MSANFHNAFNDLIGTLLQLYLYVLLWRIILQAVQADYYNPISQLISKATQPLLRPFQHFLPRWRRFDPSAAIVMVVLTALYIQVMAVLWEQRIGPVELLFYTPIKILVLALNLYIFSLVIQAILSWVGPGINNPAGNLLWVMNEPLLKPVRRVFPPVSGLDFAPLVVILALLFFRRLILLPGFF